MNGRAASVGTVTAAYPEQSTRAREQGTRARVGSPDADAAPVSPGRPCWLNSVNPNVARIFPLRRVYADGVREARRAGHVREWERWAGWWAVQNELANTIAYNTIRGVEPHVDDVALFRRVVSRRHCVTPR